MIDLDLGVLRAKRRAPRCMAIVYLKHLDDMPRQCSNRTSTPDQRCWRHKEQNA